MNPRVLLFALLATSLAANGVFVVREHSSARAPIATDQSLPPADHPGGAAASSASSPTLWQRLAHGDVSTVAALRSAGWPEEILQRLVTALVAERLHAHRTATLAPSQNYWIEHQRTAAAFDTYHTTYRAKERENSALLKTLFGDDYLPPEATEPGLQGLPREKAAAILRISNDYADLRREIYAKHGEGTLTGKQLALLDREERADIARTLTPEEFFEYELRNSITASELRYNTAAFEPTEEEFRALFRIKNALDEPAFDLDPAAARKLRKDTEAALDVQARAILGEERFQQLVLSRDAEYRRFYHLSKHLDLPAETARTAYQLKADIDRRSRALDADPATTADERTALAQEAEARLTALYGAEGVKIYKHNSRYLDLLRRPPSERPRGR